MAAPAIVERSISNREVSALKYEEEQELIEDASTAVGLAASLGSFAIAAAATGVAGAGLGAVIPVFVGGKLAAREIGKGIAKRRWEAEQARLEGEAEAPLPPEDEEPEIDIAMWRWDTEFQERHGE